MDEELAVLCTVQSELEAQTVRGMLDEAEIPCIVRSSRVPGYDGVFEVYAGYYAVVLVHATDAYRARRVTEDWQEIVAGLAAPDDPAPPALTRAERLDQHRTRLTHIAADALTALVMLLALPVLLVDALLRRNPSHPAQRVPDARHADDLEPVGGQHAG